MSKFKIGDEIHYMECNKPKCSIVKGIARYEGTVKGIRTEEHIIKENEQKVVYHFDNYDQVAEVDAFSTVEELKTSLFSI